MKKKSLIVFLVVIMLAICLTALVACGGGGSGGGNGGGDPTHTHTAVHHQATATCTEAGSIEYWECSGCGKYFSDAAMTSEITDKNSVNVAALGHIGNWIIEKEANCTEEGLKKRTCTRCGFEETEVIAPSHNYDDEWHYDDMYHWKECTICGAFPQRFAHTFNGDTCSECGYVKEPATQGLDIMPNVNGFCTVTGIGTATDKDIVIPSMYEGKPVTKVAENAFLNNTNITSVVIPGSVTVVYESAFEGCTSLRSVRFGGGLEFIASYAFSECTSLQEVDMPSCKSIGTRAFEYTAIKEMVFPNNLQEIHDRAFFHCSGINSLVIPEKVTMINEQSFAFSGITSIYIPKNVEEIGKMPGKPVAPGIEADDKVFYTFQSPFEGCEKLTSIVVDPANPWFYSQDNCLIDYQTKTLHLGCSTSVIPNDIKGIRSAAFSYTAPNLEKVTIPRTVKWIGSEAFWGCKKLKSIYIPNTMTYFAKDVENSSISNPSQRSPFADCYALESIVVEEGNPTYYSVNNCLIVKETKVLLSGCKNSVIPNDGSVVEIGWYAFYGSGLAGTFSIPKCGSSIQIGKYAFANCTNLETIKLGTAGVDSLISFLVCTQEYSFANCTSLRTVYITKGNKYQTENAFAGCTALRTVYCQDSNTKALYSDSKGNENLVNANWIIGNWT